jgi:hypothetical protein
MVVDGNRSLIISYLTLRRLIGLLAMALPVVVVIGGYGQNGHAIQGSISGYYYTNMRDVFVGLLSAVSLFLISYTGYERIDNVVGNLSGVCALGTILFPTGMFAGYSVKVGVFLLDDTVSEWIHLAFGSLFFLSLSFFSIILFTRRGPGVLGKAKKRRNGIYRTCGGIMIAAMIAIVVYTFGLRNSPLARINPVLILESVALMAFGVSWLVKGNTLFRDRQT